jgi:hypothetical protein
MRRVGFILGAALVLAVAPGCGLLPAALTKKAGPPAVVIPDPPGVSQVTVDILEAASAGGRYPGAPFQLVLRDDAEVKPVLDWLRGIDWTQEGADVATMDLPLEGGVEITRRDGALLEFALTPGGIVYERRLRNADTGRLEQIVNRLRKQR